MQHAFPLHSRAGADVDQKIGRPMLDEAGPNPVFDVVAAAIFNDDRLNAVQVQQPCKHQARGPCADNSNLSPHKKCPGDWFQRSL